MSSSSSSNSKETRAQGSTAATANNQSGSEWLTVSASDKKRVMRRNRKKAALGVAHPTAAPTASVSNTGRLVQIVHNCRTALQSTQLYRQVRDQVVVTTAAAPLEEILCLGLGNFSRTHSKYYSASMWQLALLLQLREDLQTQQQQQQQRGDNDGPKIYYYDPVSTAQETAFLTQQEPQIQVLDENDQGKRKIPQRTLVFMPHCPAVLYENLFYTNPTAFQPHSATILIGNSICNFCETLTPSVDMPTLRARLGQLDERQLVLEDAKKQPGDFEKAFNDTFIIRGKREATHTRRTNEQ